LRSIALNSKPNLLLNTDNLCKYLAEQYPAEFVRWLLPSETSNIQVLKTELNLEPIRADSITLLQTPNLILHLEFQTLPASDPPLPLRMLDYWLRLHRKYRCNVKQVVIFLKPTTSELAFTNEFTYVLAGLRFDKNLIRQLFREEIMLESVTYQDILEQGGRRASISMILRLLTRKISSVTPEIQAQIQTLSIPQLEDLGEALLDFSQPTDLTIWLESHQA